LPTDLLRQIRGRLKVFRSERSEAVRAGFGDAWRRRDYAVIVAVAQRLPERVVQEDADLLMVYDNASMRMEGNPRLEGGRRQENVS
jgi:hypothetical protein